MRATNSIPIEELRKLVDYSPLSGELRWRIRGPEFFVSGDKSAEHQANAWNERFAGTPALSVPRRDGYLSGRILGKAFTAHRVAWCLAYGEWPDIVDHIDGNRTHNKLANLRDVSRAQSAMNKGIYRRNTTGVAGVSWHSGVGKWVARFQVDGRRIAVGCFFSLDEASAAIMKARLESGFHANHGCRR